MFIKGLHEKDIFTENYPFRLALNTQEDFDYPLHWHSAVELVYAVENGCKVLVNSTEISMKEKDILLIAGGDVHGFNNKGYKGLRVFVQFDISLLDGFGDIKQLKPLLSPTRMISSAISSEIHSALEAQLLAIIDEYEKKQYAYAIALNARIYDILVIIARSTVQKPEKSYLDASASASRVSSLKKVNQALQFIEENYQSEITLKDVSRAAGFSEYHLSRVFKEVMDKSFRRYLNELRIKRAEQLIMKDDINITDIAYSVGFNSVTTFNRAFREARGCTPSEYKRMYV